jgi:hypothetical protein
MKTVQRAEMFPVHDDLYLVLLVRFWIRKETPEGFVDVKHLTWQEFGEANTGWTPEQGPSWFTGSGVDKITNLDELRKRLTDPLRNNEILPEEVITDCVNLYIEAAGEFTTKLREEESRNE